MRALLLLLFFCLAQTAGAREISEAGRVLAASCSSCHTTKQDALPVLVHLDAATIERTLRAFKSGERTGTLMNRIARGYTDEELALLARTLGRQ